MGEHQPESIGGRTISPPQLTDPPSRELTTGGRGLLFSVHKFLLEHQVLRHCQLLDLQSIRVNLQIMPNSWAGPHSQGKERVIWDGLLSGGEGNS